jgi:hypothetical protein
VRISTRQAPALVRRSTRSLVPRLTPKTRPLTVPGRPHRRAAGGHAPAARVGGVAIGGLLGLGLRSITVNVAHVS